MNATTNICSVCDEVVEPHTDSLCGSCGQTFHLNQREDLPGKDCGEVWINPDHYGLEFTCTTCLRKPPQAPFSSAALESILDLAEAAAVLGMSEHELKALAEEGAIAHRKTFAGHLLFERAGLSALQSGTGR